MNRKKPIISRKSATALALMAALPSVYFVSQVSYNGALGQYNQFRNEILLRWDLNRDALLHNEPAHLGDYVTEHEWAHWIWRKRKSRVSRDLYCKAYERTDYSPTDYGRTNCAENFAEVYAGLVEGLLEYDGSRYQHFAAWVAYQRFEQADEFIEYPK